MDAGRAVGTGKMNELEAIGGVFNLMDQLCEVSDAEAAVKKVVSAVENRVREEIAQQLEKRAAILFEKREAILFSDEEPVRDEEILYRVKYAQAVLAAEAAHLRKGK